MDGCYQLTPTRAVLLLLQIATLILACLYRNDYFLLITHVGLVRFRCSAGSCHHYHLSML